MPMHRRYLEFWQVLFFLLFSRNIVITNISLLMSFSNQQTLVVDHWSLSYSKVLQVSWALLSIMADAVVEMVSILLLILKFFKSNFQAFGNRSKRPNYSITVIYVFFSFLGPLARSQYLFSISFISILWSARTAKSTRRQALFSY